MTAGSHEYTSIDNCFGRNNLGTIVFCGPLATVANASVAGAGPSMVQGVSLGQSRVAYWTTLFPLMWSVECSQECYLSLTKETRIYTTLLI